jgi:TolB-like protein
MSIRVYALLFVTLVCGGLAPVSYAEQAAVYPVAILPFEERGADVRELGGKVTDLLFAELVAKPGLFLVDRADVGKVLQEQELNLSGAVNPNEALRVGQLTGAKILVTGSVLQVDSTLYLTAKVIGTETGRVVGDSVKGQPKDDLGTLAMQLADKLAQTIPQHSEKLVPKAVTKEDRIAALKKQLADASRPALLIKVTERHVGARTIDPAAETELTLFAHESGFEAIDPSAGKKRQAEILITGEGMSEFAARHGNLISVKARLEVKAVDPNTGRVVAIERHTAVAVDLTEQLAGKAALQEASAAIAERLLPKLVKREIRQNPAAEVDAK